MFQNSPAPFQMAEAAFYKTNISFYKFLTVVSVTVARIQPWFSPVVQWGVLTDNVRITDPSNHFSEYMERRQKWIRAKYQKY